MYKAGESLREISRLFGVNLRRLRRGLARSGLRVAGMDVSEDGHQPLAPFRARLGQEPDAVIAEAAGVGVEAVQGERRRLNIAPFRKGGVDADAGAVATAGAVAEAVDAFPAVPQFGGDDTVATMAAARIWVRMPGSTIHRSLRRFLFSFPAAAMDMLTAPSNT